MALQFGTTGSINSSYGVKCVIYGESGVGKTRLARTCPNVLVLTAEAGLLSLRQDDIPFIQINTVQDLNDALEWIIKNPQAQQFKTIFIDSVTEIAEVILANAKKGAKDPRQAYGVLIEQTMMTIRAYRDMLPGRHVVMVAKQEPSVDEFSKMTKYGPSFPGAKLANQIPYLFDEVLRLGKALDGKGNPYLFLQTVSDLQFVAKDRSGALAPLEPPDLSLVFNKILGV